jgi:hypothetical protein
MAANTDGVRAADPGHQHAWPSCSEQWDDLLNCRTCGLVLLRGFVGIADGVVRRVESIEFVDDRTVRRRVSVDYAVPRDAVVLRLDDGTPVRVLPLALMRRKSMVNFDFRDHDGRPMPLLGLRENQALTLAVVRAWPRGSWRARGRRPATGRASRAPSISSSTTSSPATRPSWPPPNDEPLTLLHSTSSYQGHEDGPCPGTPLTDREPEPMTYGKTGRGGRPWAPARGTAQRAADPAVALGAAAPEPDPRRARRQRLPCAARARAGGGRLPV